MNVLVGCEESATVREEFARLGHNAWSCDLQDSRIPGKHIKGDVREVFDDGWDLAILHPPCTYMCNSGVRWLSTDPERWKMLVEACEFFNACLDAPIPRLSVENPIMHKHARRLVRRDYDQIIQPWQYGDGECKATCLWLKGLPRLRPTSVDAPLFGAAPCMGRGQSVHLCPPGPDRARIRSTTFPGIARAMAEQWGGIAMESTQ